MFITGDGSEILLIPAVTGRDVKLLKSSEPNALMAQLEVCSPAAVLIMRVPAETPCYSFPA